MLLYLVSLGPRARSDEVLSEDTRAETGAVVMSPDEAAHLGFSGIPSPNDGTQLRIVACREQDSRRVEHAININDEVLGFRVVHVDD